MAHYDGRLSALGRQEPAGNLATHDGPEAIAARPEVGRHRQDAAAGSGSAPGSRALTRLALAARPLLVETAGRRLRWVAIAAYWALARVLAAVVRRWAPGATVFLRGSGCSRDHVPGLSDIDLVVAVPARSGAGTASVRRRWGRVVRLLPPLGAQVSLEVYGEPELAEVSHATLLTHGLEQGRSLFLGRGRQPDDAGLLVRPALAWRWRRLAGDSSPPSPDRLPAWHHRLAAWLELQALWRFAFRLCVHPGRADDAYLCLKLFSDSTRALLWSSRGRRPPGRMEALDAAVGALPEEEGALNTARGLAAALSRSPRPPLEAAVGYLLRTSARLAADVEAEASTAAATDVQLLDANEAPLALPPPALEACASAGRRALPLADWRARANPCLDEALVPMDGGAADPGALAVAAAAPAGVQAAIGSGDLLVLPAGTWGRGLARAVQCPASDPVSTALLAGRSAARFPEIPGWSAADVARRAVIEHAAWLRSQPHGGVLTERALGLMLSAIAAALSLQTLEAGEPELPLTASAAARRLSADDARAGAVAEEAAEGYATWRRGGPPPPSRLVVRLDRTVRGLAAYRQTGALV